ncbi:hypothetical protein [Halorubrum coriense]|uniref:hypothetical protein n=1 Tax=Halorubrum coriense TaxID=64713 RepID=UPI0009B5B14C|nr:hypothetical protein [Halorubrum coriense]
MTRVTVVVFTLLLLVSGTVAPVAAFTDGDEVAPGSEVYLDAADSENADKYVQFDASDEVRLQFGGVPPGSRTRVDDLFVVGFDGYQNSDNTTTVGINSANKQFTLTRMDTGATFDNGEITLQPGESVVFGVILTTEQTSVTGTINFEVNVPDGDSSEESGGSETGTGGGPLDGVNGGTSGGSVGGGTDAGVGSTDTNGTEDTGTGSGDNSGDGETPGGSTGDNTGGDGSSAEPAPENTTGDETGPDTGEEATGPTLEPGGLQFGTVTFQWSLFGGLFAAFTNYFVQTRVRNQLPVLRFDRSQRRERLKPVVLREAAIGVGVFVITVAVAGLLSGAGITGNGQLAVTVIFSALAGGVTGYRRFPYLDLTLVGENTKQ